MKLNFKLLVLNWPKKKNDNSLKLSSRKFEKKINEIKNNNIKNLLSQLLKAAKND